MKRFLPLGFGLALAINAGFGTAEAATSPMLGNVWDVEVTVPAGAYRANKPIEVKGDGTRTISRGAFIDGINFATRGGEQHWKFEGAQLRKVQVTGKRNSSIHGVASVFEEFGFHKDDSWYNFWWSTRSRFENCIFTKRFLRGDLPPLDYAAHAERCTFYGVNLPWIGMKENPAGYLQKENMGFVKCRFVQCEVPETFLAATVDCVFENCHFQAKRHDWPKDSGPIKVNAYYVGQSNAPKSFINGPLTVQFSEAPRTMEAGSDLPHSQSAGRVLLSSLKDPGQYTMLGSIAKPASEIPVSEDPTTSLPTKPLVVQPSVSGPPTAKPAVNSLAEILRPLPAGIELISGGQLNVKGIEAANTWLASAYPGKQASFRVFVEESKATKEEGYAFQVLSRSQAVIARGVTIQAQTVALFRQEDAAALASVSKGREITISGQIKKAALEGSGRSVVLRVGLEDARVQ